MKKLLIAAACLLAACAAAGGFTDEERAVIRSQQGRIMRLCTIDDREDSLFLRLKAAPLGAEELASDCFGQLKRAMLLTVRDSTNEGVGIAAPQVGVSRRLIAVQRFDKPGEPFEFYVNPQIVHYSQSRSAGPEGCLSIPDIAGSVLRADTIVLAYVDGETLLPAVDTVRGFTAIIFQHETDHLDGVLFTDKMLSGE